MIRSARSFSKGKRVRQIFFLLILLPLFFSQKSFGITPSLTHIPLFNAVYGVDDREFVGINSSKKLNTLGASIAMVVPASEIEIKFKRAIVKANKLKDTVMLCEGEKFREHLSLPNCTAFLIAPDIMASAGHCFKTEEDCKENKFIFEVKEKYETTQGHEIPLENIFSCKEIIESDIDGIALIRLEKSTVKKHPLKLNLNKELKHGGDVFMLGHPFGLPLMYSKKVKSKNENSKNPFFLAPLDSFVGNSGSPVFNAKTYEVEGVLISGKEDLYKSEKENCYKNQVYAEKGGENIAKIRFVESYL